MKTKSLLVAIVASLFILSGCSKDDEPSFSWVSEFKTAQTYIDLDSAQAVGKLTERGFVSIFDGEKTVYSKGNAQSSLQTYVFSYKECKVNYVLFGIATANLNSDEAKKAGFIDLVNYIGPKYTTPWNKEYTFQCCYFGKEGQIHSFTELQPQLDSLSTLPNVYVTWKSQDVSSISVERLLDSGLAMNFSIEK